MSSLGNDSTEAILQDWVKRARSSQREGTRLMAQLIREAKRNQGKVQRTAHEALVSAAGMLRHEVDQLALGLKAVSHRLESFEQEQKKAPARTPARRVRRTTAGKRRTVRKAA